MENEFTFEVKSNYSSRKEKEYLERFKFGDLLTEYRKSTADKDNPLIRCFKELVYEVLGEFIDFDPESDQNIYGGVHSFDWNKILKLPERERVLIFAVMYYAIKFRSFNYVFETTSSNEDIVKLQSLCRTIEGNLQTFCNNSRAVAQQIAKLMLLVYDKMLTADISFFVQKPDKTEATSYIYGDIIHTEVRNRPQSVSGKYAAVGDDEAENLNRNRLEWKKRVKDPNLTESKNTYLYGGVDVKELNRALAPYGIELPDYTTKHFKGFQADFINIYKDTFTPVLGMICNILRIPNKIDITKEFNSSNNPLMHPFKYYFKKMGSLLIRVIPLAIVSALIIPHSQFFGSIIMIGMAVVLFSPWTNQLLEKNKRLIYSILQ